MFALDVSDNFDLRDIEIKKTFIKSLVQHSVPLDSRIAVFGFDQGVQSPIPNQFNNAANNPLNQQTIGTYIDTLKNPVGGTPNLTRVLDTALGTFQSQSPPERDRYKLLILFGFGEHENGQHGPGPCATNRFRDAYRAAGIRVVLVQLTLGFSGVRNDVACMLRESTDLIVINDPTITASVLERNRNKIEETSCPDNFRVTITEVSPSASSQVGFVEMINRAPLNTSISTLKFSGLIEGDLSDINILWPGDSFLVLFDLDDTPRNVPSCRWCDCMKRPEPSVSTWCSSSIYIGCTSSSKNFIEFGLRLAMTDAYISQKCRFNRQLSFTNWTISVLHVMGPSKDILIDKAQYERDFPVVRDWYTYELRTTTLNNTNGSNWHESCGSPGSFNATCTASPTSQPSKSPSITPSMSPSTSFPTRNPSKNPTNRPTKNPVTSARPTTTPTLSPTTTKSPTLSPTFAEYNVTRCSMQYGADGSGVTFIWDTKGHALGRHPVLNKIRHDIRYRAQNQTIITITINATLNSAPRAFNIWADTTNPVPTMRTYYTFNSFSHLLNCSEEKAPAQAFAGPGVQNDGFFEWFPWGMWVLFVVFIGGAWLIHRAYANSKMKDQADEDLSTGCCPRFGDDDVEGR